TPVVTTRGETPVVATLHNYGDTRDEVHVRLFVGRARAEEGDKRLDLSKLSPAGVQTLALKGKQQTPVAFKHRFAQPGDYLVRVEVDHDGLEVDDVRSAVVTVKDTVPVLLVNGKPAGKAFDRATEWLRVALDPLGEREETPAYVTARPKVLSREQFADEALGDLTGYDCVFLCDVPRFSPAEVRRLEAHVRRGGSAVFCLGNQVDLKEYND